MENNSLKIIKKIKNYNERFINILNTSPDLFYKERQEMKALQENSNVKAHSKLFDVSFIPTILDDEIISFFQNIIDILSSIFDKITKSFLESKETRQIFFLNKEEEELVLFPSKCLYNAPIGRIDLFFLKDGSYKFCEFNTDGTGGMSRQDFFEDNFFNFYKDKYNIFKSFNFNKINTVKTIAESFSRYFKDSIKNYLYDERPFFIVTDFQDEGVFSDFNSFISCFKSLGFDSAFVDVRDLSYDEKRRQLVDKNSNRIVNAVYRRAVTSQIVKRKKELNGFIDALEKGYDNFLCIGDFRSTLSHSKSISSFVFEKAAQKLFSKEEKDFIREHFPFTIELSKKNFEYYKDEIFSSKDKFILKPKEGFASLSVQSGYDLSNEKWQDLIFRNLDKGFIVQEFIISESFPVLSYEKKFIENMPIMFGIYHCLGRFISLYSRSGKEKIIDFNHNSLMVGSLRIN